MLTSQGSQVQSLPRPPSKTPSNQRFGGVFVCLKKASSPAMPTTFLGKFWANCTLFGQILGMKMPGGPSEIPIRSCIADPLAQSLMMPLRQSTGSSFRELRMTGTLRRRNGSVLPQRRQSHLPAKDETLSSVPIEPALPQNTHKPLQGLLALFLSAAWRRQACTGMCRTFTKHGVPHLQE